MWHMFGYGYGYSWLWMLGMNLLWIAAVVVITVIVLRLAGKNRGQGGEYRNSSLDILQERYARGEISEEEYISKKKILRQE
ncbi:MAG: hypothetical protein HPY66_3385 [Firmicutes bacterium]|nr:hypothetical protein [Bacillota bacterium]MDI6706269.1 SHOCT domain-containing protein [Bacillota bacterium]